jgi:hypothetical protein
MPHEGGVGLLAAPALAPPGQQLPSVARRPLSHFLQEPGLADAGLTGQQEQRCQRWWGLPTLWRPWGCKVAFQTSQLARAPSQQREHAGERALHAGCPQPVPACVRGRGRLRRSRCGLERGARRPRQRQRVRQQPQGVRAGRAVHAALQRGDGPRAQARPLRQRLLGQAGHLPVALEHLSESRNLVWCGVHAVGPFACRLSVLRLAPPRHSLPRSAP